MQREHPRPGFAETSLEDPPAISGGFVLLCTALLCCGAVGIAWGAGWLMPPEAAAEPYHRHTALGIGVVAAAAGLAGLLLRRRIWVPAAGAMRRFTERVDELGGSARGFELFVASLLGLFLEVLLIRWHASELRAAAYFKNTSLLAAFLGLGLGFAAANRARLSLLTAPIALAAQIILLVVLATRGADDFLRVPTTQIWIWGVAIADSLQAGVFYGFYALLFVSTILIFVPIGQLTGRLMRGFSPIRAYTINILGSLCGVLLFGVVSYFWLPPLVWFALAGVPLLFVLRHERLGAAVGGICLACLLAVVAVENTDGVKRDLHTPYQRLEVEPERLYADDGQRLDTGVLISANKAYHLRTANLSKPFVAAHGKRFPRLVKMAEAYDLPYQFGPAPARVLVVGAGGGNDVAAALRNGAAHVDAVEIDPGILELGRRMHAENPYGDPRVTVHLNDARAYMRHAPSDSYDLIVFGLLDSHTLLSGMSTVRIDNFVYTQESIDEARRLLKADGALSLSFATGAGGFLGTRLFEMIEAAFGHPPRCFRLGYDDGTAFIAGRPAADPTLLAGDPRQTPFEKVPNVAIATDDWPFLYLQGRQWHDVPRPYLFMIAMLAIISIVWILAGSGRRTGISPHFFFLGGAFLLIEVKGITELALVFGTTWIVNSVVIAAILLLILLANLFVTIFPRQNRAVHYAFLAASLLAGYFVPVSSLLERGWWTAALGATALLVVPLFFAGVIFATSLKQAASLPRAFSSNLLGAILGGLCEYGSLVLGFRNLYLVGLALYALSFMTLPRRRAVGAPADERFAAGAARPEPVAAGGEAS